MKIIYIAGPFRAATPWAVEQNVRRVEEWGLKVAELGGAMPLMPHCNTRFFDKLLTDEFWLEGTKELLRRCDACFLVPGWEASSGARGERGDAMTRGMPVFVELEMLSAWLRSST